MSILLKTIEAFPTGRTTSELYSLLDAHFDRMRRDRIRCELSDLQNSGAVWLDSKQRWRPVVAAPPPPPGPNGDVPSEDLVAVPITITARSTAAGPPLKADDGGEVAKLDPGALLRYYRSALMQDPRGEILQTPERHGREFQLLAGAGRLLPEEGAETVVRIRSDSLPDEIRERLVRLDGEENGVALGWPLDLGRSSGAPAVRPVGLLAATWSRDEDAIELRVDVDDVLVNPEWVKATARSSTGWSREALHSVFQGEGGAGLRGQEFMARLREAAAKRVKGSVIGNSFAGIIRSGAEGIHDALAVFLPSGSKFTAGAASDLDAMATWSSEQIGGTALGPFFGCPRAATDQPLLPINLGPLNMEQIEAAASAMGEPLSVVTGPPGTGKTQVIVSIVATALRAGRSVVVASKNHQALDAVESQFSELFSRASFLVRTLDPARKMDRGMGDVLQELVKEPAGEGGGLPGFEAEDELDELARRRMAALERIQAERRLRLQLSNDIDRLDAREWAGLGAAGVPSTPPPKAGFWTWLLRWLGIETRGEELPGDDNKEISTEALRQQIERNRRQVESLGPLEDPVKLTDEIAERAQNSLMRRISARSRLNERQRLALSEAKDELDWQGSQEISRNVAEGILHHRPLWLVSTLGAPKRIPLEAGLFDLAVFDESSQCDIASSLPVLARARRAVIVGDDRQLSFIPQLGLARDRNLMAAQHLPLKCTGRFAQSQKSLFDFALSTRGVRAVMLRDQYRSAEDIVEYLSGNFYGGQLRVAGDQEKMRPPPGLPPGLCWTHVRPEADPGRSEGNTNLAEVRAVAEHLRKLLIEQGYEGSVGVITPFRPQVMELKDAIDNRISRDHREQANLRVGTIDAFQGQERDLILFSPVVSSRSAQGAVNFLNRDWRRLNVAISRARAVVNVFGDLEFARTGSVRQLRKLAARATEPPRPEPEEVFDSAWEKRVYHALRGRGLSPKPQYWIAGRRLDFALFGNADTKLDLEVDGRYWHQDVHGDRKLDDHWRDCQLRSLGWKVRRFWVDQLANDMEGCLDIIEKDLR